MPDFEKINGVAAASIEKIDGVSLSSIESVNGINAPAGSGYSNAYSLTVDGVDDWFEITFQSDPFDKDNGTVLFWIKVEDTTANTSTKWFFEAYDESNKTDGRIGMQFFNTSGSNVFALNGLYVDEISQGSFGSRFCAAKTKSTHHGKPWNRIASDYGDFDSASDTIYNANNLKGGWHMLAMTWNTSETYTDPTDSTSYTGTMKLYIDGVLVNFGQGSYTNHNTTATAVGLNGVPSTTVFDKINIGNRNNNNNEVDALIDEFAVWNTDLSAAQIRNLWNGGNGGVLYTTESGLNMTAHYRFENNANSSLTGGGPTGTLNGNATYQNTDLWP